MFKTKINIGYLLIFLYLIFSALVFASVLSNGGFLEGFAVYSGYLVIPLFMWVGSFVLGDNMIQALTGFFVILIILVMLVAITKKIILRYTK